MSGAMCRKSELGICREQEVSCEAEMDAHALADAESGRSDVCVVRSWEIDVVVVAGRSFASLSSPAERFAGVAASVICMLL